MTKTTLKNLKDLATRYNDITYGTEEDRRRIIEKEGWLEQIMYAAGVYGCNGMALRGHNTGDLYVIAGRTPALYLFG